VFAKCRVQCATEEQSHGVISWSSHTIYLAATLLAWGSSAYGAEEWITVNKDYSSQRYVDLDQITPENVSELKELCELQLNEASWFSSGLLMVGQTLYVSTLRATYAIDATSCELRWRNVIELGQTANISSRGPAYLDGTTKRADIRIFQVLLGHGRPVTMAPMARRWPRLGMGLTVRCTVAAEDIRRSGAPCMRRVRRAVSPRAASDQGGWACRR
jgi:hypothetical protein